MRLPIGSKPAATLFIALSSAALPAFAGDAHAPAVPAAAAPAAPAAAAPAAPAAKPAFAEIAAARAARLKNRPPAPLKHLSYSERDGFSLRMVSDQEVSAEIRNGAGRTLAFTSRTLDAGDWTFKPRNLSPGLYTVLLRTGPNLRALHMKIDSVARGEGRPEWVVEKADSTPSSAPEAPGRGAMLTE